MKHNILFISLKAKFCKNVCKMFCDQLDMLYADFDDMMQYNLINQNMIDLAGKEYFDAEQQKLLKSIAECENVAININFDILNADYNLCVAKQNCLIIYLKYKKDTLKKFNIKTDEPHTKQTIAYTQEDAICCKIADVAVNMTGNEQEDCINIIEEIKKYYGDKKVSV